MIIIVLSGILVYLPFYRVFGWRKIGEPLKILRGLEKRFRPLPNLMPLLWTLVTKDFCNYPFGLVLLDRSNFVWFFFWLPC